MIMNMKCHQVNKIVNIVEYKFLVFKNMTVLGFKTSHNTILISSDVVASTPTSSKKKSLQQTKGS